MSAQNDDITQILDTLGRLKDRVRELDAAGAGTPAAAGGSGDALVLLRAGLAELGWPAAPACAWCC